MVYARTREKRRLYIWMQIFLQRKKMVIFTNGKKRFSFLHHTLIQNENKTKKFLLNANRSACAQGVQNTKQCSFCSCALKFDGKKIQKTFEIFLWEFFWIFFLKIFYFDFIFFCGFLSLLLDNYNSIL